MCSVTLVKAVARLSHLMIALAKKTIDARSRTTTPHFTCKFSLLLSVSLILQEACREWEYLCEVNIAIHNMINCFLRHDVGVHAMHLQHLHCFKTRIVILYASNCCRDMRDMQLQKNGECGLLDSKTQHHKASLQGSRGHTARPVNRLQALKPPSFTASATFAGTLMTPLKC